MIKDTPEGTTHYQNDGCGEPEHNDMSPQKLEEHTCNLIHSLKSLDYDECSCGMRVECPELYGGECREGETL